jgi:drug/metabolite transporter (DMT)-like permease
MNKNFSHVIVLAVSVAIMSSSGSLGRMIHLPPPIIIWTRSVLGALALFVILHLTKDKLFIGWGRTFKIVTFSGVMLGIHWITYFYALHLSTVALGMLSLFTYPLMTALLEPLMLKTKFNAMSMVLAVVAFGGVLFMIPDFTLANDYTLGITFGLISALFYSIRNISLKAAASEFSGLTLMYNQLIVIVLLFWPVWFFPFEYYCLENFLTDWKPILVLGILTTAIGHSLYVSSFRHFSITTASIFSTLSPILGSVLGFLLLDEVPSDRTVIGGAIVVAVVVIESLRYVRKAR